MQSHRLIGWIYWDPRAIANYAALGVPDGIGYYIATRGATLGHAGNDVVTAAFYSIHPDFVAFGLDQCRAHTTFEAAAAARDAAVVEGLREYVPEICDDLAAMADDLWAAADALPIAGSGAVRVDAASGRVRPTTRCCRRGWRSTASASGGATPTGRSRSPRASAVPRPGSSTARGGTTTATGSPAAAAPTTRRSAAGFAELEARGLAVDGVVNDAGIEYRQGLEDRLDDLSIRSVAPPRRGRRRSGSSS